MIEQIVNWISSALEAFNLSDRRIVWNLFLAFIPLLLSILLFRQAQVRSWFWWIGFLIFIAFLPNAPYILTDAIHLFEFANRGYSSSIIIFVLIPQYSLFIFAGFEAYVISLMYLNDYLQQQNRQKYTLTIEIIIHTLSAIGIYLGRFERFNSWDFVTQPIVLAKTLVHSLLDIWHISAIASSFLLLIPLSWLVKQANLRLLSRIRSSLELPG
jgi:uncharacterized membrane protein